jgi:hypothetical protein
VSEHTLTASTSTNAGTSRPWYVPTGSVTVSSCFHPSATDDSSCTSPSTVGSTP